MGKIFNFPARLAAVAVACLMRSVLGHASQGERSKKYHFRDMLLAADTNAAHEASDEIDFCPNIFDVFKQICIY